MSVDRDLGGYRVGWRSTVIAMAIAGTLSWASPFVSRTRAQAAPAVDRPPATVGGPGSAPPPRGGAGRPGETLDGKSHAAMEQLRRALAEADEARSPERLLRGALFAGGATAVALLLVAALARVHRRLSAWLVGQGQAQPRPQPPA